MRKILHNLGLPSIDVTISPEHNRKESNGLGDGEEKVDKEHASQNIMSTIGREEASSSGVSTVIAKARESKTSSEESKRTTGFTKNHNYNVFLTAFLS